MHLNNEEKRKVAISRFKEKAAKLGFYIIGSYITNKRPVIMCCPLNHYFSKAPHDFVNHDSYCPFCSGMVKKPITADMLPNIEMLSKYYSQEMIAKILLMHPRTLRKKLGELGTSYTELRNS